MHTIGPPRTWQRRSILLWVWLISSLTSAALALPLRAQDSQLGDSHLWSKRFGSTIDDYGYAVAVDGNGDVLLTGSFQGTVNFGGANLTSAGSFDVFVAKYSGADGAHLWSKRFGSSGGNSELGWAVAVDGSDDVLITGIFGGTVNFGGGNLTSAGLEDIFVAKYSGADGAHLWSKRFGSTGSDRGRGVAVDGNGDVLLTGAFLLTVNFGGGNLSSAGNFDIVVAKFSGTDGTHLWSRRFGGTGGDEGLGVAVDGSGNPSVTGTLRGAADLGGGNTALIGVVDMFVAKYSGTDGAHLWSKRFGSTSNQVFGNAVAVDSSNDVLVTGDLFGTVNFGGGILSSAGSFDIVVAKFSGADGAHFWSRRYGSTSQDNAFAVAVDSGGGVLASGDFVGTVNFGGDNLTSAGLNDIFVAKYSGADGSHLWSKRFGSSSSDNGYGVAVDGSRNAVVTGTFSGAVDFGGGELISAGNADIFVVKFGASARRRGQLISD